MKYSLKLEISYTHLELPKGNFWIFLIHINYLHPSN